MVVPNFKEPQLPQQGLEVSTAISTSAKPEPTAKGVRLDFC